MRNRWIILISAVLLSGLVADPGGASTADVVPVDGAHGVWTVRPVGASTRVRRVLGATSSWSTTVAGNWSLPEVAARHLVGGASADGSALALIQPPIAYAGWTHFAVVTRTIVKRVGLRGRWGFDALSVDGRTMFLTESVGNDRYWVRPIEVATGRVGDPIVTKSITPTSVELDGGPMEGLPMDRLVTADGITVFTLYDGPAFPFIHALNVTNGGALCYELIGSLKGSVTQLRLRLGSEPGSVDVRFDRETVAQIWTPSSLYGPSVRIAGTANAPR